MQGQEVETAPSTPIHQPQQPQPHQSETWEDVSHPNPIYHTIIIRINLPKEIYQSIQGLTKFRQDKAKVFQAKEATADYVHAKEKYDAYRRMDERMKDEEKKKNSEIYRSAMEVEQHNMVKQKLNFPMFEGFQDRGKTENIRFSHKRNRVSHQNCLQVRLRKTYVLQELRLSRNAILALPASFVNTWQTQLFGMIKVIYKLSNDCEKSPFYNLFIKSIDLVSITFDIQYGDKRIYRFRYSPFEFRSGLFFKDNTQLSGYNQNISMIPEVNSIKTPVMDSEFYLAPRCFIFDDLTDFNMALKILQRSNLFYMAYSISRGSTNFYPGSFIDSDQYTKKCLWNIYFSTTRLKKFIFTWSFRPYKKSKSHNEEVMMNFESEVLTKEIIFHAAFYVEVKDGKEMSKEDPLYRIRVQYHEPTKAMPLQVREEIISRTKDWYLHFRQISGNRDITKQKYILDSERISQFQRRRDGERENQKPDREDSELEILFSNRDRFDRFLVGFLVIVSTVIDRNFFTMIDDQRTIEQTKTIVLETPDVAYMNDRQGYMSYYHWLEIHLEHKILPHLFHSKEERSYLHGGHGIKGHELRMKCGEWRLSRICKCKREWNRKIKKESRDSKGQEVPELPEIFREYVDILLRHFPLRAIYKDIINFVQGVAKNCYQGWQQSNDLSINIKNKDIFVPIISAIRYLYYSYPLAAFKDRDQKNREKIYNQQHSEKHDRSHDRLSEEDRAKRDDRLIDQFSKVVVIKILTKGDPGFMAEDKLLAEVTFRLMEFKLCWVTRVREGVIMLRVFEDRLEFVKDYQLVEILKYEQKGKGLVLEESAVKEVLQKISVDFRHPLIL